MICYIYKLIHNDAINDDMIYIGSTIDIKMRMYKHKDVCKNPNIKEHNSKVYKYIRENGGWNNWKYEIIDEVDITDKYDPKKKEYEGEYIRKYDALNKLNSEIAGRTLEQYRVDNAEYFKKYYEENAEKESTRCKKYREKNIEKERARSKKYYENNVDKIKEKVCCEICSAFVRSNGIKRHQRTPKCLSIANK
jgi:hypothetical protein